MQIRDRLKAIAFGAALAISACSPGSGSDADKPRLILVGDSTASDYTAIAAPQAGWGQALRYFLTDAAQFENRAVSGRSLRTFIAEGRWDDILEGLQPTDIVLISMGHNDARDDTPSRYADPRTDFPDLLRQYVQDVRDHEATAVIVSPVPRRLWEGNAMVETHGLYLEAYRTVAAQMDVPFVNLSELGLAYLETIGAEETKKDFLWLTPQDRNRQYPSGIEDNTHLSRLGACGMAYVLAGALAQSDKLAPYIDDEKPDQTGKARSRPAAVNACASFLDETI
ncbi:rhamnogalacturonan acetylesterase [Henriciella sp. AS95]|uniref:rhamnogalacturonan acetylesterase n=1 Tax=Henriciella sp. AS95 TaxID=3135782 RepID=UPI00317F67E9